MDDYLDHAKVLLQAFVGQMQEHDFGALITFDATVMVEEHLTNNHSALLSAIVTVTSGHGSNLGDAVKQADRLLEERLDPEETLPVILIVSDGRADSTSAARNAAETAKQRGRHIVAIGLGDRINTDLLRAMASRDSYYHTPASSDSQQIYQDIIDAHDPCKDNDAQASQ